MTQGEAVDRTAGCRCIPNFRDYGAYATPAGRLRRGRLYRSAQHRHANAADLAVVAAIGLGVVVDLRSAYERDAAPCPRPSGFDAVVIHATTGAGAPAPHLAAASGAATATEARAAMIGIYRAMPFGPVLPDLLTRYVAALSETDRPTLIHCRAGKDRTGLAVALFHHLAGVHPDDAMADYLLTNAHADVEARVQAGGAPVKALFGDMSDDALRVVMSVEPAYLAAALTAITERCGSIPGYLRDVLKVTTALRDRIAARLLE